LGSLGRVRSGNIVGAPWPVGDVLQSGNLRLVAIPPFRSDMCRRLLPGRRYLLFGAGSRRMGIFAVGNGFAVWLGATALSLYLLPITGARLWPAGRKPLTAQVVSLTTDWTGYSMKRRDWVSSRPCSRT